MNSYYKGKIAEFLAYIYMRCHGYSFVCRNYVTGRGTTAGEIDLIMRRHNTLIFIEIKQRSNIREAAYAISERQKQRILRGAQSFLQKHKEYKDYDLRFDAILIHLPLQVEHITNAWHE